MEQLTFAVGSCEQPRPDPAADRVETARTLLAAGASAADVTLSPDDPQPSSPEVANCPATTPSRGKRLTRISPGIIFTPLAMDELTGPRGEGCRRMLELSPVGRGGTPDEVGTVDALFLGPDGAFITGSDFLMDGVTASYFYGELAPQ